MNLLFEILSFTSFEKLMLFPLTIQCCDFLLFPRFSKTIFVMNCGFIFGTIAMMFNNQIKS